MTILKIRIKRDLKKWIKEERPKYLPSITQLSQQLNCSPNTLRTVQKQLSEEGIIRCHRGRLTEVVANHPTKSKDKPVIAIPSHEIVCNHIIAMINNGLVTFHERLPKIEQLAKDTQTSIQTVTKACKVLNQQGFIYRKGRFWYIGKEAPDPIPASPKSSSVIFVLTTGFEQWRKLGQTDRTRPFIDQFCFEAERRGIQLMMISANSSKPAEFDRTPIKEIETTKHLLQKKSSQWIGTLIACTPKDGIQLEPWFELFRQKQRPVIWYNRYDVMPSLKLPSGVFQFGYSEEHVLQTTANYLSKLSTNRFAFFMNSKDKTLSGWAKIRYEGLLQKLDVSQSISQSSDFPIFYGWSPKLKNYLAKQHTLVICASDRTALDFFNKTQQAKLSIPESVSALSIGNTSLLRALPINSIDRGLNLLGYHAFQIAAQYIPWKQMKQQTFPCKPYMVNRNSIKY